MRRFFFLVALLSVALFAVASFAGRPAGALIGDNVTPQDQAEAAGGASSPLPPGVDPGNQPPSPPDDGRPDFVNLIKDRDTWYQVAAAPKSYTVARAEVVKFIFDLKTGKMFFTNTQRYPIHYDFVAKFIDKEYPHELFNEREYRSDNRRFAMGSIVHYRDPGVWTMEIIPGDTMSPELMRATYMRLQHDVWFSRLLKFRPQSALHEKRITQIMPPLPVWNMSDYQDAIRYQPLTLGKAIGRLRIIHGDIDVATVRPNEILVTDHVPEDLPPVAGLVTSTLQAPLAHISILMENRNTANMSLKDAVDADEFKALDGQIVRLDVGAQDYTLKKASLYEAEMWWNTLRPEKTVIPSLDDSDIGLPDLCRVDRSMLGAVGGKAGHLGEVCTLPGVSVPGGFVVPTYQYRTHLARAGVNKAIAAFLAAPRMDDADALAKIRAAIMNIPVDKALIAAMRQRIRAFGLEKVILRSSTNVEDVQGFNGAGLYSSKVIRADADDATLAAALKYVWASVWNYRAFEERDWFRIDHGPVAMAVLVQPYIDHVAANGVAITANPFYMYRPGVLINVQTMDGSITAAHDGTLPESLLIYTYGEEPEIHVLSRSTLNGGKPIMTEKSANDLLDALLAIHKHFYPKDSYTSSRAIDVEFLLRKNGWPVILQARPYKVHFHDTTY